MQKKVIWRIGSMICCCWLADRWPVDATTAAAPVAAAPAGVAAATRPCRSTAHEQLSGNWLCASSYRHWTLVERGGW